MTLFGVKQVENMLTPRERDQYRQPAVKAMDSVTHATVNQLGENLRSVFRSIDNVQRGLISIGFALAFPFPGYSEREESESRWDQPPRERAGRVPLATRSSEPRPVLNLRPEGGVRGSAYRVR
jgi:hypothetical protein